MERKYFGTDGIRGKVGEEPVTPAFIMKLGWAVGRVLAGKNGGKVLIGKDTRISGYMLESALEAGLSAAGMNVRLLGPMPTPAIAYLTRTLHAQAGIVISASHNPYYDNGIKFFSSDGYKLNDGIELAIEAELEKDMVCVDSERLGKAERVVDVEGRYIEFCKSTVPFSMSLSGMSIVIDCAHGACYKVAPAVLDELGAKVIAIGNHPNGININDEVGSTKPAALQQAVLRHKADLGIALDGDGDRVLMVDHKGELVDGDELLFIIAHYMHADRRLKGPVVGTLMSNLGLEVAFQQADIGFVRSKVGDRYVMEQLQQTGGVLGGETSGHLICLDRSTTGDGMIAALQVLHAMVTAGKSLQELKTGMVKYPQRLENVAIKGKVDLNHLQIQAAVQLVEQRLGRRGRVLLRPSGTEPLIRVMVEGEDAEEVMELTDHIANAVRTAII